MSCLRRVNYSSGAPLEETVGYSRAVKVGNMVYVGGTTIVLWRYAWSAARLRAGWTYPVL